MITVWQFSVSCRVQDLGKSLGFSWIGFYCRFETINPNMVKRREGFYSAQNDGEI